MATENFFRCDNEVKALRQEREKMKQRIVKLKSRKGRMDLGVKICKKCGKDYNEKDNLNWSCRQHMSQYSGEMWWCCRKKGLDAAGCQFSRHEERKDDEEDDDPFEKKRRREAFRERCHSCKEMGHSIEKCPRDPNIRTRELVDNEMRRIAKQKDFRKLF